MDTFAMAGADQLHLKMVIVTQALFDEHAAVSELAFGIALDLAVDAAELLDFRDLFNAHAAAAGRCLDQDGGGLDVLGRLIVHEPLGDLLCLHLIVDGAVGPGNGGYLQRVCDPLGVDLVAKAFDDLPVWTDKGKGPVAEGCPSGKTIIFREKTIPR